MWNNQKADFPYRAAYFRYYNNAEQRCADRDRVQNVGTYKLENHPALCEAT